MFNNNTIRLGLFRIVISTVTPIDKNDDPYVKYGIEFITTKWDEITVEYSFTKALEFIGYDESEFSAFYDGMFIDGYCITFCPSMCETDNIVASVKYKDVSIGSFDSIEDAIKVIKGELDEQKEE